MAIVRIQQRRDTASNWTSANPTLAPGEMGIETDTDKFKLGNGSTAWTSLGYGGIQGPAGADGADGTNSVVAATAPLAYNSGTSTVSIDLTDYDTSAEVDTKVADSKLASFITDATTARTLTTAADEGKTLQFTSGSATVLTVDASSDFTVGARVDIIADGTGALTVTADGATIKAAEVSTTTGSFTIGAQYSAATLLCVATDEYRLIGNITVV
jgi:hypothetical protein